METSSADILQSTTLLEVALEKSKSAVKGDSGLGDKENLKMYKEAVNALQKVLEDNSDSKSDKPRLKSIQETYLKRIEHLSSLYSDMKPSSGTLNNRKSIIRTPSLKNILSASTNNTKSTAVALSSVFSKNKRLSNYTNRSDEEVKHLTHSRKPSFFNIKPSRSTPTMDKQKNKKDNVTTSSKKNILNRYSSDFSRLGNILLSRNPVVIGDSTTIIPPTAPTLHSFDNLYTSSNEKDQVDLRDSTTLMQEIDSLIEPKSRNSTESSVTTIMSTTPTNEEELQHLSLSNSDSTLNDKDIPDIVTLWETQVIVEDQDEAKFNNKIENSTFASRVIEKSPSIASNMSQHIVSDIVHPMESSVSTSSSFQSLLRRKKSSKKDHRLSATTSETTNHKRTTFVSYLNTTTKTSKKSTTTGTELNRSKSKKKWSLHISTGGKIPILGSSILDPVTFLAEPFLHSPKDISQVQNTNATIALMDKLLESMLHGGRVTSKLHIPMDLWYQSNVKLPATDPKIAACELLLVVLDRMDKRKNFNDCTAIETELKVLEQTLVQIKYTLIKKLGLDISDDTHSSSQIQSSSKYSNYVGSLIGGTSGIKTSQTVSTWSSKLTKSVERMKHEASKAILNSDQNDVYIKTLIRLFTAAKVMETWNEKLIAMVESDTCKKPILYERASNTNLRCIHLFKVTVCQFVLKDYETLLDKWLKRSMDWITE